jgi:hypothetical protein
MANQDFFQDDDVSFLNAQGIDLKEASRQLSCLAKRTNSIRAEAPCRVGDGIVRIAADQVESLLSLYEEVRRQGRVQKMIPASGAASRMFQSVFAVQKGAPADPLFQELKTQLSRFPFFGDLKRLAEAEGKTPQEWSDEELAERLLAPAYLGFGDSPKAFIPFHRYPHGVRTALEEQLHEALGVVADDAGRLSLHFTIDPSAIEALQAHLDDLLPRMKGAFEVTYSIQYPSTQTLAMDDTGTPVRENGRLLLRPGGHGALLENLNRLKGDYVFIQNIDNVGRAEDHESRAHYKKLLGGMLRFLEVHRNLFLRTLKSGEGDVEAIRQFCETYFGFRSSPEAPPLSVEALLQLLNRPLRVCGMVKNEGEPGGGPFWVGAPCQHVQILEKAQLDLSDPQQRQIFASSTHFNPVDLVCSLRDPEGKPYPLKQFVDEDSFFISEKSYQGKPLYALEHPGLWNGAMGHWNSCFVEVPLTTFTPVKTVNDLLRGAHCGEGSPKI